MGGTVIMILRLLHSSTTTPIALGTKMDLSKWLVNNVEKTVASYWGNGVVSTMYTSIAIQGLDKPALCALAKPINSSRKPRTP